jgi:hypothetical protein
MPAGIASICNAAARPYRVDSTDPISVIQWTRLAFVLLTKESVMMKPLFCSIVLSAAATVAAAQTLPSAGLWEITLTMEGGPGGGGTRIGKSCLAADALSAAPEQTLFEAAGQLAGGGRMSPSCEFSNVQRDGDKSNWQAQCQSPRGALQGTGSGALSADKADLQQAFSVKAPTGTMNMKQTVMARRVGSC